MSDALSIGSVLGRLGLAPFSVSPERRRVVLRYVTGRLLACDAAEGCGAVFDKPTPLQAVMAIVENLGAAPSALIAKHLESQRQTVILLVTEPPENASSEPVRTRIVAYVAEGLSELEINLALSYLDHVAAERERRSRGEA